MLNDETPSQATGEDALRTAIAEHRAKQDAHTENLAVARKRIEDHPMNLAHWETENLLTAITDVFVPNGAELSQHLQRIGTDVHLGMALTQNISRSEVADAYTSELLRLFHNYLASAYTVSEYVKTINNRRKKRFKRTTDPLAGPYQSARERFDEVPEVSVMSGLRGYVQHHSQSPFMYTEEFDNVNTPEMTIEHRVWLRTSQLLLARSFFDAVAVEFFSSRPDVLLLEVVNAYTPVVSNFFCTYHDKLVADAALRLNEYNELIVAYNAVLSGADLEDARAMTEFRTREFNTPQPPLRKQ
jgi:hypothetical protein